MEAGRLMAFGFGALGLRFRVRGFGLRVVGCTVGLGLKEVQDV